MPVFRRSASSHSTSEASTPPSITNVSDGSPASTKSVTRQGRSRSHGEKGSPASTFSSRFGISRHLSHHSPQLHEREQGEVPSPSTSASRDIPVSLGPEFGSSEAGYASNFGQESAGEQQLVPETGPSSPRTGRSSRQPSVQATEPSSEDETTPPEKRRVSPLMKRLGEEPPFMLPHPSCSDSTYQAYPGVVIGAFAGGGPDTLFGKLEGTMDDILDPNAANQGSRGSQTPAGANIAPWLTDDGPPSRSENSSPMYPAMHGKPVKGPAAALREKDLRKHSTVLNHFASVPSLPKIRRHVTAETATPNQTPRGSTHSQSTLASSSASVNNENHESRAASDDSIQTTLTQKVRRHSPGELGHSSVVPPPSKGTRPGRFGSTASTVSGSGSIGEKKKSLLGGFLKRKTNPHLSLSSEHRGSTGSIPLSASSSKLSSGSLSSLPSKSPSFTSSPEAFSRSFLPANYVHEGAVSPLQEINESPFHLDMNLDDMEGIIDPAKAGLPSTVAYRPSASSEITTDSSASESMRLDEALNQTSSFGTSVSGASQGSDGTKMPGRIVLGEAERLSAPFNEMDPFQQHHRESASTTGSDGKHFTPPSPHTLSPKHHLPPTSANQPRRPSALRNVETGQVAESPQLPHSEGSIQPISPSWALRSGMTVFNDPFSSSRQRQEQTPNTASLSSSTATYPSAVAGPGPSTSRFLATAAPATASAAWAAPESWGVEGDEAPAEETSSSDEDDWAGVDVEEVASASPTSETLPSPTASPTASPKSSSPPSSLKKAPPFGFKSQQRAKPGTSGTTGSTASASRKKKGKRVGSSGRTATGRPGTSGSAYSPSSLEEESSYDSFEFIDIANRDLQTIPIFLHLHAHDIIILNISKNPMTDIPLDFIQACTSLKELRMSNMALKRVPVSIRASTTLARLDVSCNRIADLESVALHEVETLVSLKVQNNKLTSMPSYFAQMKSLKYLNISNNKFETFPSVVCEMSNLVDLDVSFNNIAELPAKMSDLKSLEKLGLYSNDISKFPESFCTLENLRILDVRRNKITDLTAVYALPNLATLQADNNNIVTLDAQLGANVRQFSVPHNSVTRFTLAPPPNMAVVTYMLTNLDLSYGKISTLADEAFSGLTNLVTLNLNFNQFTKLPATLDRLTKLEVFSCTDNMLNAVPAGFGKLQRLRVINLHNNNLKSLPEDLWACGALEIFNASSNLLDSFVPPPADIESVVARVGSGTSQTSDGRKKYNVPPVGLSIRKLFLADNRLNDDIFHWISLMPCLRIINLSFNEIYEVPPLTLCKCDKLEALYLSGNKLTSLPSEDLETLQSLKALHLNGNKLQTLPSELGAIKTLQHLDVGSNMLRYNIANWPYDWNWNWNTSLRYLNLSGNKRLEIKPTSAHEMTHASAFRKELSDFTALTQLRVLGLMDVTLRIPSLPDESDEKRVRTSFSDINNMAYGISDMLGTIDNLAMFDLVVPHFRGKENECLFGMFGRATATMQGGKIAKHIQEIFSETLTAHLQKLEPGEEPSEALRRTFLWGDRKAFEYFSGKLQLEKERKPSWTSFASFDSMFRGWTPGINSVLRTGASGAVVYLIDKVLHVGSIGDTLVVLSRKGDAELLSKRHDPTDREESARIRKAEAWVSTKGFVNDDKDLDISRAFGYWHECPAVNAAPEIRTRRLQESDEFVIIGNHALWQYCSYQTAVDIARTERDDPMMAAQKLRDFAISYGAEGNVMVMVVNVSDLFPVKGGRARGPSEQAAADASADVEGYTVAKRQVRRRYDEVGDRTLNRLQQEIEPPVGQVAIVFTDIVNSTHLWETNPAMPTAIKMHHNLMRRQLRLDGGYEVKTEGDSFMVSFQSVTAALLWCFNCQIGLLQQEWPRELLEAHDGKVVRDSNGTIVQRGLRVRMGIHWGAPECEKDPITRRMDYYGPMGDLKREVMELRRIGLELRDMVPERLHLLYPKTLAGRLEISNEIRAEVEVNDVRKAAERQRSVDIDQVCQLSDIALRLEAVCSYNPTPSSPGASPKVMRLHPPASYLGPTIREDMNDEELWTIIESLVGRIENAMSTLYLKNFGEFSTVLAALESATKIDQKLIVHALALMNKAMGKNEENAL
ncbi:adenylate cyclase [Cryptococcus deuterogattii 99/473]|uniref:Adenylate cyclase n=1 Tax=Cryptococcus deuterogattii Ram5 TaxID=1296110 RepID=A0A0D0U1H9_9TREE|nr:adenylate cyclase [Cryptococcus deuterogattii Ram5]KIY55943.1 adenylate cyclase [Cryptococcus deuterogattii 99/473]